MRASAGTVGHLRAVFRSAVTHTGLACVGPSFFGGVTVMGLSSGPRVHEPNQEKLFNDARECRARPAAVSEQLHAKLSDWVSTQEQTHQERLNFPFIEDSKMEWYVCVLVLILSTPTLAVADCTSRCLKCAQEVPRMDTSVDSLTCTLECEGALSSSWEINKCDRILNPQSVDLTPGGDAHSSPNPEDSEDSLPSLVKRYGGFIKRIDKNKLFKSPWYENAVLKGLLSKKFEQPLGKFGERATPEFSEDTEGEDVASENETGIYEEAALNPVKRYGGFLRKFPKRSESSEENTGQELQKRYGGFMRRIRPKLRWDNQKRYGGFLRRHFKMSVRSEDPAFDDVSL
ncbi:hypothetical protein ACEWY4_000124 [Coilia grayii]|uniref:Proenkephalin-B n=1 Tax=Coilia grayii TaxID=363190 RepID=A0ABD1KVQ8_9TELE